MMRSIHTEGHFIDYIPKNLQSEKIVRVDDPTAIDLLKMSMGNFPINIGV